MLNLSVTDNQVMDNLISLVPDFVLSIMKGQAGIRVTICPAESIIIP